MPAARATRPPSAVPLACPLMQVHLFRPWSAEHLLAALPQSVRRVCVMDRTKEHGSGGEPLLIDVSSSLQVRCGGGVCVWWVWGGGWVGGWGWWVGVGGWVGGAGGARAGTHGSLLQPWRRCSAARPPAALCSPGGAVGYLGKRAAIVRQFVPPPRVSLQRGRRHVDVIVGGRYGLGSKDFTPAM